MRFKNFHPFASSRPRLTLLALVILLSLLGLVHAAAPTTSTTPAWKAPDPLELKDQELRLLRRQLGQSRAQYDQEHVGRFVYETQLRVAALHGFAVKDVVTYAPLSAQVMDRLVADSLRTQYPGKSLEHYVWINQLFAALPSPFDMTKTIRDLMGEQAAGVYDPHSKRLYVKTDFPLESPLGAMILSHEICHAFQDQNFSLIDLGAEESDDSDLAMATLSIAEGDATLLMTEYFVKYGNPLDILRFLPSMMSMDQEKLEAAPPLIQKSLLFPYLQGMKFFKALGGRARQGGARRKASDPAWRNEIFKDPPTTTQQILHPDLYLAKKLPEKIAEPKLAGVGEVTQNIAGEFGIEITLEPMLGETRASEVAAGWAGDKFAVADSADGKRRLAKWVTRWDSPAAAEAFTAALEEALKARFEGKLEWRAAANAREAALPGAQFKLTHPTPKEIDFSADCAKDLSLPQVKTKASPMPMLSF